ncbi:hypothetical protein FTN78_p100008 (plasmid) [Lactococcus lactis subsp. lactis bv. diacetylactis]|nr:hypothetical protein FTN78_p100008 [Lactococcus lactis subsp. lactis bv. diacetylactis]
MEFRKMRGVLRPQGIFPKGRTSDFSIEVYKRSDKSEQGDFML